LRGELNDGDRASQRLHFLAAGTVKWQGRLDYELDHRLPKGTDSLPPPCRAILRLALFEMRMTDIPDYAVVDTAVHLTRIHDLSGLTGLVNGVLRQAGRSGEPDPPENNLQQLSVLTSHPLWLLEKVSERFGFEIASDLAEWNNLSPPLWVRVNTLRNTVDEAFTMLTELGVGLRSECTIPGYLLTESGTYPVELRGLDEGLLTVQDPSAGLASLMLDPAPGMRIADICAAPGGKSTHLVELGKGEVEIVATDSDRQRLERLQQNVLRHGSPQLSVREFEEVTAGRESYDGVIVDVPCSNLGVLRRRADARWRIQGKDLERLAEIQLELLEKGAELVRPGGVLVYSTCTLTSEENEMVIDRFLSDHVDFEMGVVPDALPGTFRGESGTVSSLPWKHGVDGAFAARLIRQDNRT
jgi:16S rRNA (cytosine967-C5)-methyltransferase